MNNRNRLKQLFKTGVAATALYAGGMGLGQAEPLVDYGSNDIMAPIVQTVQKAQTSKVQLNQKLSEAHLEKLKDNVNGGAWFSGNEGLVRDALDSLAQTQVGKNVLSQLPQDQNFRIANSAENKVGYDYGIAGSYRMDNKEFLIFPWIMEKSPQQVPLMMLHEGVHRVQELSGKMSYQNTSSPYVYGLGNQLIEAEAVAAELELLREKPEFMPQGELVNGRDNLAPFYNQMWQKNYDNCQDKEQATQMTQKQFIKKMVLNENPNYGYSDQMSAEEKCNAEITHWQNKYDRQGSRNFDENLKKKMNEGKSVIWDETQDFNQVKEMGKHYGFSPEESQQMYDNMRQNSDNSSLNMCALAIKGNPKNFEEYQKKSGLIYQNFKKDISEKGTQFAQDKLKSQVESNQDLNQNQGLLKTLSKAQEKTPEKGITSQLANAQEKMDVKQPIKAPNVSVVAALQSNTQR